MNNKQKKTISYVLFWTFWAVYLFTCVGTLAMLFFGFGTVHESERTILTSSFVIETGAAIFALFYSIFGLKKSKESKEILKLQKELEEKNKVLYQIEDNKKYNAWYDRRYILVHNQWFFNKNDDTQLLDGTCEGIRHIKCIDSEILYIQISFTQDASYLPFNKDKNYEIQLLSDSKRLSGSGNITISKPHRCEGASFAFRIYFDPPLVEGEEAYVHYKYTIPSFKFATLTELRKSMLDTTITTRDYEVNTFQVIYPIEKLIYELNFSPNCNVSRMNLLVRRGSAIFKEERDYVIKNNLFKVNIYKNGGGHMILERKNPPMKAKYIFRWKPTH